MADASDKHQGMVPSSGDLFDGLSLDYTFLDTPRSETKENDLNTTNTAAAGGVLGMGMSDGDDPFALTPRVAHMMASLGGASGSSGDLSAFASNGNGDHMLFDHDVASNGISGTPRSAAAALLSNSQQQQQQEEDMPTPLSFSFSPSPVRDGGAPRYHTAPQHKHKRVRSNPDVIFSFQQTLHSGLDPVTESAPATMSSDTTASSSSLSSSPMRPSIVHTPVAVRGRTVSNELANAVISSILNDFQDPPVDVSVPVTPPMAPIGTVQVMTPVGLNAIGATPIPFNQPHSEESFKDMDEFLQDLSWAELPNDGSAMDGITTSGSMMSGGLVRREVEEERTIESSPVAYRSQRIQEGVNELKMKRKRPQHGRHHSNPVDLLHNLDQFRILAQQTKQQQQLQQLQQQDPSSVLNPYALPSSNGIVDYQGMQQQQLQQQQQQLNQYNQFQVPPQIASGAVRSLHDRRSSLPNGSGLMGASSNPTVPPRAAARRAQRSSGLSMDLSQMNLGFLAVPEEEFQQQYQQFQQQQPSNFSDMGSSASKKALADAAEAAEEANRKLYKCGRCGQPKVGHVCTMPDQRNNWTQVDLEVTKGLKVMRINCHILPVKSRWVTLDEENLFDEQQTNVRME